MHLAGANTQMELRYDGDPRMVSGSTLGQVMFVPGGHRIEGTSDFPTKMRHVVVLLDSSLIEDELAREKAGPSEGWYHARICVQVANRSKSPC